MTKPLIAFKPIQPPNYTYISSSKKNKALVSINKNFKQTVSTGTKTYLAQTTNQFFLTQLIVHWSTNADNSAIEVYLNNILIQKFYQGNMADTQSGDVSLPLPETNVPSGSYLKVIVWGTGTSSLEIAGSVSILGFRI